MGLGNTDTHGEHSDSTNTSSTTTSDSNTIPDTDAEIDEEARLSKAIHTLRLGSFTIQQVADDFSPPYHKLRRQYHNESKPKGVAYTHLQLLTPTQEEVVCDRVIFLGLCGEAVTREMLGSKICKLAGIEEGPSKGWWKLCLNRHPKWIRLAQPSGIPPKCAQAFNFQVVSGLFEEIDKVLKEYDILWKLVFNMDEKGLQVGSQKVDRKKCFIPVGTPNMARLQSDSLQLITVIECISAKGVALDPAFIFPGESHFDSWYNIEGFEESKHL